MTFPTYNALKPKISHGFLKLDGGGPISVRQQRVTGILSQAMISFYHYINKQQTATPSPKITRHSVDSIQPEVMDVGVENQTYIHIVEVQV